MPNSKHFLALKSRIDNLNKRFITPAVPPTGDYSETDQDMAKAFCLLAHAEFEAYIEVIVKDVADASHFHWQTQNRAHPCLVSLLVHTEITLGAPVETFDPQAQAKKEKKRNAAERVEAAVKAFKNSLYNNNGIKEEDLSKLLMPIGVKSVDIDQTWLSVITSFGSTRGSFAHSSNSVHKNINPKDEAYRVGQILEGFEKVDGMLQGFIDECQRKVPEIW